MTAPTDQSTTTTTTTTSSATAPTDTTTTNDLSCLKMDSDEDKIVDSELNNPLWLTSLRDDVFFFDLIVLRIQKDSDIG
ncbi:hypothetical protein PPL_12178 [Heterostelium album PN500]|uniref:Uncharacterized protein n=1 Tax=Heterostelium pallidum (strain ATCC 26659 / Pp 5 / PN500) TaxID=670386 RepID=D3BLX4_HETP5|nr:hypothetical protein PPL_12178 [Heterostelium album PN500]EFA77575.1 hypothetical protein PPL_12178 [Heterostelium album PN500]|eukprot:XP_020429703.1 hypothetical protein PPL_12178 [Heterostelium album PN500]